MERKKTEKDIGLLKGKVLAFGGIYSNLQALEKLYKLANEHNIIPSNIICTGDIVGYCAQPEECLRLVKDWGIHVIAGNVEIQLREEKSDCGCDFNAGGRCDTFSRQWYPFAKNRVSNDSINWMKTLPDFIRFKYAGLNGIVLHGSWNKTSEYIFKSTLWSIKQKNLKDSGSNLIISGHSGLPFSEEKEGKYWLNPGVIGMPANDGTTKVWYMILDDKNNPELKFKHHHFEYDFNTAARLMESSHLPLEYTHTLKTGIWDNCEILPEAETKMQGHKIRF